MAASLTEFFREAIAPYLAVIKASSSGDSFITTTADYTAKVGDYILVDTSSGQVTITMPSGAAAMDRFVVADYNGTFSLYNCVVGSDALTFDDMEVTFIYDGSNWKTYRVNSRYDDLGSVSLQGGTVGNEGTEIYLSINGYDWATEYTISVTGGSFSRTSGTIVWMLPIVAVDTVHTITVNDVTHDVIVLNIPVSVDTSISITDFSVNKSNDGWTV